MMLAERDVLRAAVIDAAMGAKLTKRDARVLLSMVRDVAQCEILLRTLAGMRVSR